MDVIHEPLALGRLLADLRQKSGAPGFVPTMGALHEGHLSLVRLAAQGGAPVVMSIFVNPTQFGPLEDLARYPRDLGRDAELACRAGVDVLFAPAAADMYPAGHRTYVDVEGLNEKLCGRSRPGHFRGVATVVTKLLHMVRPERLYLGQKDAQQVVILKRVIQDLSLPVEVVVGPTVREPDGLALSSRNRYLSREERQASVALNLALGQAARLFRGGERRGAVLARAMAERIAGEAMARLDYAEVVDPMSLEPLEQVGNGALCAIAALVGATRLIDNQVLISEEEG